MTSPPPALPATPKAVVEACTRPATPAYVPEVRLRVADEVFDLWQRTGRLPYWAFAWAGGLALARHVLDHPGLMAGRAVLDLASGSGLVAIAAARAGAASVIAADIDPLAGAAIALNAEANDVRVTVLLDDLLAAPDRPYGHAPRSGPEPGTQSGPKAGPNRSTEFDPDATEVVLAGDVFYERPMAESIMAYLERARRRGATVVVGDPDRAYLPRHRFTRLTTHQVPGSGLLEAEEIKTATVWRLP
ncbi:50S ribosomal protein L11 methyltransferase [Thermopolyspora sp. NPDC052614]|uniref:class I SAM-dependent methyltransferase n=1 Tax=Thermopolyspora sp. NPDC052614 TaxID=3155682 RepID=UPI003430C944